jgi:DNA (cytosine-5)-methyltransferase 1
VTITFGSLFAGIGGFDLGFERAGMSCKWQVEIDDYANRVLAKHWPDVARHRDIRCCGGHNLSPVDVICGGFPCQDISYAGRGAGLDGERSGLFFEAVRLVCELRPRVVVLENVAALLTRGLDRVLGTLAEIGYDAEWHCVPAASVGAPHIRDRVFVIGTLSADANSSRQLHRQAKVESAIRGVDATNNRTGRREQQQEGREKTRDVADSDSRGLEGADTQGRNIRHVMWGSGKSGRETHWAVEPDVGRVAHGVPKRVDRLRGLGNAVVPQVAEFIGRQIVESMQ